MITFKSPSSLAIVTSALALAACGTSQQAQPNTPTAAESQYGSTMSQPNEPAATMPSDWRGSGDAGHDQPDYRTPESPSSVVPSVKSGPDPATPQADTNSAPNTMRTSDVSSYDDAQIAAVLHTINHGEISEAELAEGRALSPDVKRFAHHMAHDHGDMQSKDKALLSRIHVVPNANAVSEELKSNGETELSGLKDDHGRDFDVAYMDAQVKGHQHALELVDRMIGNVKNADLRSEMQATRSKVEAHLQEAERIQQSLQQGSKQ